MLSTLLNDPSLSTASVMAVEKLLNKALQYDPATRKKINRLENIWIHIATQTPELNLYFSVSDENFTLRSHFDDKVDAKISGQLVDFIRLTNKQHSLSDSSLHVSGKSGLLTELQNIFSDLEIDWEQALCAAFGILPGHLLAEAIRKTGSTINNSRKAIEFHFADYLGEELRAIPSKAELEYFYQDVDELTATVNRLEARITHIIKHATQPE